MLLQPRTFQLLQLRDRPRQEPKSSPSSGAAATAPTGPAAEDAPFSFFEQPLKPHHRLRALRHAQKMLLLHQAGSVKVGQVVRYTLTYTPSRDRVLPTPSHLHLKVKNTSAIPLRAAWVHGPYALHVSACPASFDPHRKVEDEAKEGVPEYEPMVKAGGSWTSKLTVPEGLRETGVELAKRGGRGFGEDTAGDEEDKSVTWVIDIASQILFSNSASVGFEVLVGRDERSLELGFAAVAGHRHGGPAQIGEGRAEERRRNGHVQTEGVYSRAVRLVVEDTETLWDKPALPAWEDLESKEGEGGDKKSRKKKRIHLVVLTHGLHSNVGADLLFLKESIDATVKQARVDAKERKQKYRESRNGEAKATADNGEEAGKDASTAPLSGGQEDLDNSAYNSDDEEETIVRGFSGNAVKTENGIQYLGKRLAKWILSMTYPDQPFLPVKKKFTRSLTDTFRSDADKAKRDGPPVHHGSSIHHPTKTQEPEERPYKYTSISFVGHSLGGLIQLYAIGYIQKHSPTFFELIEPINFVALAAPMLGLSNENPMYVKFALDFGLVGRTGQDLGLTWRPPGFTKSSWNTMIAGFGAGHKDKDPQHQDPGSKPLLRILPRGPAHRVLRMFRNRTLYSNVVNDGIVPLRTSCLLFLDWRGLGKVEKARRENGLLGTMAEWGWAELTGVNASSMIPNVLAERYKDSDDEDDEHVRKGEGETVPQPAEDETAEDNKRSTNRLSYEDESDVHKGQGDTLGANSRRESSAGEKGDKGVLEGFLSLFRTKSVDKGSASPPQSKKTTKALRRGQTIHHDFDEAAEDEETNGQEGTTTNPTMRPRMQHSHTGQIQSRPGISSRGQSFIGNIEDVLAPPTTSIFESAGDILHPPLPSKQWITDPATRKRTIFHDRVYHPEDIPPPPARRTGSIFTKSFSSTSLPIVGGGGGVGAVSPSATSASTSSLSKPPPPGSSPSLSPSSSSQKLAGSSGMKVEEKIARDYHSDLSWRKVLVRLEPDAHNNMIVRRMFANAYGWPVIKHLCDTHFADTYSARTRDEEEPARERARPFGEPVDPETGDEVFVRRGVEGDDEAGRSPADRREDGGGDNAVAVATSATPERTLSETREAMDQVAELDVSRDGARGSYSSSGAGSGKRVTAGMDSLMENNLLTRLESVEWDDEGRFFEGSEGEDEDEDAEGEDGEETNGDGRGFVQRLLHPHFGQNKERKEKRKDEGVVVKAAEDEGRSKDSLDRVGSKPLVAEPEEVRPSSSSGSAIAGMGLGKTAEVMIAGTGAAGKRREGEEGK